MAKSIKEWLDQSEYDLATAQIMRDSRRNFYAVFMCHMAIEKALKALSFHATTVVPLKTHNLILLLSKAGTRPPTDIGEFISALNQANVATRYPDELTELIRIYTDNIADDIIRKSKDALAWIKNQL